MAMMSDYTVPGEFVYDGVTYNSITNVRVLEQIKVYPLTKDDILIATYPKSGTRWVQEIVWLLMNEARSSKVDINNRVPFLEWDKNELRVLDNLKPGPKLLKTHLYHSFFNTAVNQNNTKVIVVMRNIRDELVSYYHFYQMHGLFGHFAGTWSEFFSLFKQKRVCHGDWLDFNLGWWEQRHLANVDIIFYEDLKDDPEREIRKMANFCEKNSTDDAIKSIVQKTTFKAMSENPATNSSSSKHMDFSISPFMRKGEVGDWKRYFTPEQLVYLDQEIEPALKEVGLKFRYEL